MDMRRNWLVWSAVVAVGAAGLVVTHWYAYCKGRADSILFSVQSTVPGDLRMSVRLLNKYQDDPAAFTEEAVKWFRGKLRGAPDLVQAFVLPAEKRAGREDKVAELQALVEAARALDSKLKTSEPGDSSG